MARGVTLEMVAHEAGVSRGTVDRVINQRPHVRQEQYDKVMEAVRKLGYVPKRGQAIALGLEIPEKKICRLGVILPARNPYYLGEIRRGISDAQTQLADYSVEILTEQCSGSPYPEEITSMMGSLVARGAEGIVLCAMNSELIADEIDGLSKAGIPVVTFDSDIPGSRLFFYGKDPERSGRVAGSLMAKYVSTDSRVLIGMGNREIEDHAACVNGFIDVLKTAGFKEDRIDTVETFNDYTLTYKKVSQALEKQPYGGVYMANHSLTGCMDAVRGLKLADPPFVIYSDMTERVARYLRSGELDFCVTPNAYMMGYHTLILLKEYIMDHKQIGTDSLLTPIEIICKENITE